MRKTAADRKNELIAGLANARQELLDAVRSIPPELQDTPCIGHWCAKDLVAHLIGWDKTNLSAVQEILNGERPSFFQFYDKDWQSFNTNLVNQHRREPFSDLLVDAEGSHHGLVAYLLSLAEVQILEGKSPREKGRPVTIRRLLGAEAEDERKHAEQVRTFLQRWRNEQSMRV
jgi:hypothetical protein